MPIMKKSRNLRSLLTFLNLEYKTTSDESEVIIDCIFCGKESHLYIEAEEGNAYYCQKCGEGGTGFYQKILQHVVNLSENTETEKVRDFFESRGIKGWFDRRFGFWAPLSRYTIPYFDADGEVADIAFRVSLPDQEPKYLRLPGSVARPYILDQGSPQVVIIVEGELDAALLSEHVPNARVLGIPGAQTIPKSLSDYLWDDLPIRIIFDNDEVGIKGAKKLAKKLQKEHDGVVIYRLQIVAEADGFTEFKDITDSYLHLPQHSWIQWVKGIFEATASPEEEPEEGKVFRGLPASEYLKSVDSDEAWLIKDLWNEKAIGFIAGFPKVMKSTLAIALGAAVAGGKPFLNHLTGVPKRVLLFQEEDADYVIRQRVQTFLDGSGDNFIIFTPRLMGRSISLASERSLDILRSTISHYDPALVILDPFANISGLADENSASEVNSVLEEIRGMRDELGVSFAIIHHLRKSGESSMGQRMRGSSVLHAKSECAIYVSRSGPILTLDLESKTRPDRQITVRYGDDGKFYPLGNEVEVMVEYMNKVAGHVGA